MSEGRHNAFQNPITQGAPEGVGGGGGGGDPSPDNSALWGYLQPYSETLPRINLYKEILRYTVGREGGNNYITLNGAKVSVLHCVLTWDLAASTVQILDMSTNGTWLDGEKVGKGKTVALIDGTEIGFGTAIYQPADAGIRDFRYIFHYTANGPPTEGIRAYFEFGRRLGRGGNGTVFLAKHPNSGSQFAVKRMLKSRRTLDNGALAEVAALEQLEHPNICKLIQVFDSPVETCLILEYVNGGDLISLLNGSYPKGFPEIMAKDIAYQACDAMAFIHSKGIIHRDLKFENILVTNDPHPIVKIADFGLATAVDGVTLLRQQCGTPYYIAPEMNRLGEDEGYDHMVDSWSMGVIVFAMLAGELPFASINNRAVPEYLQERTIDWYLLADHPGLYPESIHFVRSLLEEDPAKRLSLADSLGHAWLRDHIPFHVNIATVFKPADLNRPLTVVAAYKMKLMRAMNAVARENAADPASGSFDAQRMSSEQQFAQLLLNRREHGSVGFDRNSASFFSQLNPAGGRGRALVRRRSEVNAEAAESGTALPEPSQDMIANAERRARKGKGRATTMEPVLSTIAEESEGANETSAEDEDVQMASPEKKGKGKAVQCPFPRRRTLQAQPTDRQEGPSRWSGAMRLDSERRQDENENDVEMGGSPVKQGPAERARTRKGKATAARKVNRAGPFANGYSFNNKKGKGKGNRKGRKNM